MNGGTGGDQLEEVCKGLMFKAKENGTEGEREREREGWRGRPSPAKDAVSVDMATLLYGLATTVPVH